MVISCFVDGWIGYLLGGGSGQASNKLNVFNEDGKWTEITTYLIHTMQLGRSPAAVDVVIEVEVN